MHRSFSFIALLFALGCSSDDSGSGGSSGASGSTGSGGSSGSSGSSGSGGSSGSLGSSGASGAGMSGSSGAVGSSGSGGAGGAAGAGGSADTWDNFAKGFFAKYCTGCHAATSATRDYTTTDDVTRDKAEIRCGVGTTVYAGCASFPPPRQFPIGNGAKPSDAERERLVAWIEAGAR